MFNNFRNVLDLSFLPPVQPIYSEILELLIFKKRTVCLQRLGLRESLEFTKPAGDGGVDRATCLR